MDLDFPENYLQKEQGFKAYMMRYILVQRGKFEQKKQFRSTFTTDIITSGSQNYMQGTVGGVTEDELEQFVKLNVGGIFKMHIKYNYIPGNRVITMNKTTEFLKAKSSIPINFS